MKTKNQTELTPGVAAPQNLTARMAVASLALAAATIPVVASDRSATVPKEDRNAIRPFHVNIPEETLVDLRRRIAATRWPEKETVADESQGVPLATMREVARYWATDYDWRKIEAKLNALPQFITEIDGLDIHFIHVRSEHKNALPLIISHGWPRLDPRAGEAHRSAHRSNGVRRQGRGRIRRRDSVDAGLRLFRQAD